FPPVHNDMITRFNLVDAWPCLEHHAAAFMAEQMRKKFVLAFHSLNLVQLSPANAADCHLNQDLSDVQGRQLDLVNDQRLVQRFEDGSEGLHRYLEPIRNR